MAADGDDGGEIRETVYLLDARSMKIKDREVFAVAPVTCFKRSYKNKRYELEGGQASGFFYKHKDLLYFITNRHVVIDESNGYYPDQICLDLHTDPNNPGKPKKKLWMELYKDNNMKIPRWIGHPHNQEFQSWEKTIDVVAVPVEEDLSGYHVEPFTNERIVPPEFGVSIGNEVLVIGYPLGFWDHAHNLPIVRNATIASVYQVPFSGKPGILIDARLHPGTSGSPVVTYIGYPEKLLLGVHSEEFYNTNGTRSDEPLGLNFVWFSGLILDIVSQRSDYFDSLDCKI
ncbi:MAG: serine protease [Methanothrix sp.]|nr:serine protease [Methanothrix sp.]